MTANKPLPIHHRVYFNSFKDYYTDMYNKASEERDKVILESKTLQDKIKENVEVYKKEYNIDILKYDEFVNNTYKDGKFLRVAKGAYINKTNDYELTAHLYDLLRLAKMQEKIFELNKNIDFYFKLINLNARQYANIIRMFYATVHDKMICEGAGYAFDNGIGWVCINRVKRSNINRKSTIDFAATKKREKELIAQGKRIYNKEEAEWCKKMGIEYEAEDKRVFMHDEFFYEIPLIDSRLPNGQSLEIEVPNYRSLETRKKTYDDFIKESGGDIHKICKLNLDLKAKLQLCLKVDKMLYSKFIRNDNQESIKTRKAHSKN